MERKEMLKELKDLKRRLVAVSLAATMTLGVSACSKNSEEKPYASESLSMEDYFEPHADSEKSCFMTYYIDNVDTEDLGGKTFEEWDKIYKEARSSLASIEDIKANKKDALKYESIMNSALYYMGLSVLKGQVLETLQINPNNVEKIRVHYEFGERMEYTVKISCKDQKGKEQESKKSGNKKDEYTEYDITSKIGRNMVETIVAAQYDNISSKHKLTDYDKAYQEICEFMLCKGTTYTSHLSSMPKIKFSLDSNRVKTFNQNNNEGFQKTIQKGE